MTSLVRRGSCLCGGVTVEAVGDPDLTAACHCRSCRKSTGAPVAVYADFPKEAVILKGETLSEFHSSPGANRSFCARCGSTVGYRGDNLPGMIHLHVGLFDDPESLQPSQEDNSGGRLHWIHVDLA